MSTLILASNSPRRKELLKLAEIDFEVIVAETNESYPFDLKTEEVANYIAKQKALAVQRQFPQRKIIAADTIVVLDHKIMGKPINREEAISMLQALSNNVHTVITGVCILENEKICEFSETTFVEFNKLTNSQIEHYVNIYKPFDKAGSYGIQEWIGLVGIKQINGCYYNVMGLPVSRLVTFL